jgi:hypothetical protein
MTISLENKKAKTLKLKNENSFLKNSCEEHKHLLDVLKSSHGELKLTHETLLASHEELLEQHAFLIKALSTKIKNNESSSHRSNDQLQNITNPCDVGKKHVSTSYDNLLDMPCSSYIDACSTSMFCETNLLKENNELKNKVKKLSNKLERCYNSKATFKLMLSNQRSYGDKSDLSFKTSKVNTQRSQSDTSGISFNQSKIKGKRWGKRRYERDMKMQEQERLSQFMCFKYHEVGHLANACPNEEKLKLKKEEERLKHVKCFKCCTWGHLTSMCPTKQLVKQRVEPQPKAQVEQEKTPQAQVKINHEDNGDDLMMMKKKKTRRGGRVRHPIQIQDAKMMSKNQIEKRDLANIKCFKCGDIGHFASGCPTKFEKKDQTTQERQGNEKHHMSKKKGSSKENVLLMPGKGDT